MDECIEIPENNGIPKLNSLESELLDIFNYIRQGNAKFGENSFSTLKFYYTNFPEDKIIYRNEKYTIHPESRVINFYQKKDKKLEYKESHFIINATYFKFILENIDALNFIVLSKNINLDDSNVSIDDYSTYFYDINVKNILIFSSNNILTKENLDKKLVKEFGFKEIKINNLSLNAKKYFPNTYNSDYFKTNIYIEYNKNLVRYVEINTYKRVLYLLGTKGCSKTTLLLTFIQNYLERVTSWGSMYFNIKTLENLSLTETKKLLLKEALYLVSNTNELYNLKSIKLFRKLASDVSSPIYTVEYCIKEIIENYDNIFIKKDGIIFIIDNFNINNKNSEHIICLKKIIEYIFSIRKNIKLIISGNGSFFNEKIRKYYLKNLGKNESVIYMNNINFNFPNINHDEIQNNPLYYFLFKSKNQNYNDFKNQMIKEGKEYLKNFNFKILYYALDLNNLIIPLEEIEDLDIFDFLPDYFRIQNKINNEIKIEIDNNIFYEIILQTIDYMVNKNLYKNIILNEKLPESSCGIAEEYLIFLLFKYNKFKIENLNNFKHIEKVKTIYNLQNNPIIQKDCPENILVSQDFNGKNYDLLFIIKIQGIDFAIFVQIGVDKDYLYINKLRNDLNDNYINYINNLNYSFKRQISYITLLFIFDEKNQLSKINQKCGTKICENLNIDYLWFSPENEQLLSINFHQNEYKDKKALSKYVPYKFLLGKKGTECNNKYCYDEIIKPFYKLDNKQIYIINQIVNNYYDNNYVFSKSIGKHFQYSLQKDLIKDFIQGFSKEDLPCIHIFSFKDNKIFFAFINNLLFRIEDNKFEIIKDFNQIIYPFVTWDIYRLEKINNFNY